MNEICFEGLNLRYVLRMMAQLGLLGLCMAQPTAYVAQGQTSSDAAQPRLRIIESHIRFDAEPASDSSSCMLLKQNGEIYVEIRKHILPAPTGDLAVFSGFLTGLQREQLERILADDRLRLLKTPPLPHPAKDSSRLDALVVMVVRPESLQSINYSYWSNASGLYKGAPAGYSDGQAEISDAMKPLLDWYHSIDITRLTAQPADSPNLCSISDAKPNR